MFIRYLCAAFLMPSASEIRPPGGEPCPARSRAPGNPLGKAVHSVAVPRIVLALSTP